MLGAENSSFVYQAQERDTVAYMVVTNEDYRNLRHQLSSSGVTLNASRGLDYGGVYQTTEVDHFHSQYMIGPDDSWKVLCLLKKYLTVANRKLKHKT